MSGKQNFAWYRFDYRHLAGPIFHAHGSVSMSSRVSLCAQCGAPFRPQRSDSKFCGDACRQRAHRERLAVTRRDGTSASNPVLMERSDGGVGRILVHHGAQKNLPMTGRV